MAAFGAGGHSSDCGVKKSSATVMVDADEKENLRLLIQIYESERGLVLVAEVLRRHVLRELECL